MEPKTKKPSKKIVLIAAILTAALIGVIAYIAMSRDSNKPVPSADKPGTSKINLDPPTENDAKRADDNKERIVEKEKTDASQPAVDGKKSVTPTITYAGQYGSDLEVGGYTNGVFESGGTCTATFTKDGYSFVRSVSAVQNTSAMDCPVIRVPVSDFAVKGSWNVTLSYTSNSANGVSAAKAIEVK